MAVAEIITFRLKPDADLGVFLTAAEAADRFIEALPGFQSHRLSQSEDGSLTHYVVWADLAAAQSAMEACRADPEAGAFMAFVEETSVVMRDEPILSASLAA